MPPRRCSEGHDDGRSIVTTLHTRGERLAEFHAARFAKFAVARRRSRRLNSEPDAASRRRRLPSSPRPGGAARPLSARGRQKASGFRRSHTTSPARRRAFHRRTLNPIREPRASRCFNRVTTFSGEQVFGEFAGKFQVWSRNRHAGELSLRCSSSGSRLLADRLVQIFQAKQIAYVRSFAVVAIYEGAFVGSVANAMASTIRQSWRSGLSVSFVRNHFRSSRDIMHSQTPNQGEPSDRSNRAHRVSEE